MSVRERSGETHEPIPVPRPDRRTGLEDRCNFVFTPGRRQPTWS
jgi:hypothetical protein